MCVMHTGFCVGALVAFILNLIMPKEADPAGVATTATEVSAHHGRVHSDDLEDQRVSECTRATPNGGRLLHGSSCNQRTTSAE